MVVAQFNSPVVDGWGHSYSPLTRYVISDSTLRNLMEKYSGLMARTSCFNAYEKRYCGQDLTGRRLLMYRPRSHGDQLITSALVAFLRAKWPTCVIDYYCDAAVSDIWAGVDSRVQICTGVITLEQALRYDYTLCLEGLYENLTEPDQDNCYDVMFRYAGLYDVPDEAKRPHIFIHEKERLRPHGIPDEPYILVQWEASAIYRSYPPNLLVETCEGLCDAGLAVVLVGISPIPYVYRDNCLDMRGKTARFRELLPWVSGASCVIAPDSAVGHLAACFPKVPCVSLWGSYDPRVRVSTYPNHIPIRADKVCPFAPCYRGLEIDPPRQFCEKAPNDDPLSWVCNQLKAITPDQICTAVFSAIGFKP